MMSSLREPKYLYMLLGSVFLAGILSLCERTMSPFYVSQHNEIEKIKTKLLAVEARVSLLEEKLASAYAHAAIAEQVKTETMWTKQRGVGLSPQGMYMSTGGPVHEIPVAPGERASDESGETVVSPYYPSRTHPARTAVKAPDGK
jgi:hypothetical protein